MVINRVTECQTFIFGSTSQLMAMMTPGIYFTHPGIPALLIMYVNIYYFVVHFAN
jgi:hypothetical protein